MSSSVTLCTYEDDRARCIAESYIEHTARFIVHLHKYMSKVHDEARQCYTNSFSDSFVTVRCKMYYHNVEVIKTSATFV